MQIVEIDHIGAQALEAVFAVLAQGFGTTVDDAAHHAVFAAHAGHAAFAGQGDVVAVGLEHGADQRFAGAKAIERGGVEQRHARIQRRMQHGVRLLGRDGVAVGMAEIHAAQRDIGDAEWAEWSVLHGCSLRMAKLRHL
jgi:hypothetical protein